MRSVSLAADNQNPLVEGSPSLSISLTHCLFACLGGTIFSVSEVAYKLDLWTTKGQFKTTGFFQFFFSHLPVRSIIPAFFAGLMINARFRHQVACYVWILPVAILAVAFLFGRGIYPTMLRDSDFSPSFRHFFGSEFQFEPRGNGNRISPVADWFRAFAQLTFTMPAYTAIAYSLGVSLGMCSLTKWLQGFMARV